MSKRETYWRTVAADLATMGVKQRSGSDLDWGTIEALAESNGSRRRNVPDPVNMSRNGLVWRFATWRILKGPTPNGKQGVK